MGKMNIVRVILSLAVNLDWPLGQFDVKNAFLHDDLLEEVYIDPSFGVSTKKRQGMQTKKDFVWIEAIVKGMVW